MWFGRQIQAASEALEALAPSLREAPASGIPGADEALGPTDYTSLRTAEFLARAGFGFADGGAAGATATAALEASAGLYGRALAAARLRIGGRYDVPPATLAQIARDLILEGESIWRIALAGGRVALQPLSAVSVNGGPVAAGWTYEAQAAGPDRFVHYRALPARAVVHVRYSSDRTYPWRGIGPLDRARDSARLAGSLDLGLYEEARRQVKFALAIDVGASAQDYEQVFTETLDRIEGTPAGGMAGVPSGTIDFASGQGPESARYRRKLEEVRLGPRPDPETVRLREQIQSSVFSACGVPPVLFSAAASTTGLREAQRAFLADGAGPLASLIASELQRKLETPVTIDFPAIARGEIAARARAVHVLVRSGATFESAAQAAGLPDGARLEEVRHEIGRRNSRSGRP